MPTISWLPCSLQPDGFLVYIIGFGVMVALGLGIVAFAYKKGTKPHQDDKQK